MEQQQQTQAPLTRVVLVDADGKPVEGIGQPRSIFIDAMLGIVSGIVVGYFVRAYALRGGK